MSQGSGVSGGFQHLQQSQVLLLLQKRQRLGREIRRDDDLAENLRDGLRAGAVERLVHGDDAAERRLPVGRERLVPGLAQIRALADAARIRVLENRQRRRLAREFRDQVRRRREIQNVVVGKFLAVKLLEIIRGTGRRAPRSGADFRRNAAAAPAARKLTALAASSGSFRFQMPCSDARQWPRRRPPFAQKPWPPVCGATRASCCRFAPDLAGDFRVIRRIHHHRDALVVLRRAAQHGRPADVNVFDRVVQRDVRLGDRLLERIKVHHHEINRLDLVCACTAASCLALPRMKSSPPWTLGCSVLTRPSSISGNPVCSLMSLTVKPASRSALAVPPVEISSTPPP